MIKEVYRTIILLAVFAAATGMGAPAATAAGQPAAGAKQDAVAEEPTEIEADAMSFDSKASKALLTGNVHVTSGDMEVWADRMDVAMDADNKLQKLLAIGNVVMKRGEAVAICGRAEYDAAKSKLILTDKPFVRQGKNTLLRAPVFSYDQEKETFVADGGRVKLMIIRDGEEDFVLDKFREKKGKPSTP